MFICFTLQSAIMICGMLITIIGGTVSIGGVGEVWNRAEDGKRTVLIDITVDPTVRYSLWSCVIGGTFAMSSFAGTNQLLVQRYLTCRSLNSARIATVIGLLLFGLIEIISVITGTITYAYLAGCDPISNKDISKPDQIIPLLMIRLFSRIPGLTGVLLSAAFSASLSSVSSGINALTTLTGQGIFRKIWPEIKESKFTFLSKLTSIFYGFLCIALAFLAPLLGNVLQVTLSIAGICNGPVWGVFLLGILLPWANWIGAIVGFWLGLSVGIWIQIGSIVYPPVRQMMPLSIDYCPVNFQANSSVYTLHDEDVYATTSSMFSPESTYIEPDNLPSIAWLYHISFLYFSMIASMTTLIFGAIVSFATGPTDPSTVDGQLLSPVFFAIHRLLPKSIQDRIKLRGDPYLPAKQHHMHLKMVEPYS